MSCFWRSDKKSIRRKKAVYLDGAQEIKYDRLLIATGSRPFVPPMDGLDFR